MAVLAAALAFPALSQVCATAGKDGPATLTGVVNTYYPGTANAAAGATTINVGTALAGGGPALAPGDMVLVIQMQDGVSNANFSTASTTTYTASASTAGQFEYRLVADFAGGVITLHDALTNSYANAQVAGNARMTFQVVRVPQHSQATVTGVVTPLPWNGVAGGIVAIDAVQNFHLSGTINAAGYGFRGGGGRVYGGGAGNTTSTVAFSSANNNGAMKGEGTAGTPRGTFSSVGNVYTWNAGADWYPNGDNGWGAPGNAGGGGNDGDPASNSENSGGGGGGNGGAGGRGGNSWASNLAIGGRGGRAMANSITRAVMGGGGGAATSNNGGGNHATYSGASGGGIVMIRAGTFSGAGTVNVSGANGQVPTATCCDDGGTGGGGGGSAMLMATTPAGIANIVINARGGNGSATPTGSTDHGPGGGAGGGSILVSGGTAGAGASSVAAGTRGAATWNAADGSVGTTATGLAINGNSGARPGTSCRPLLTVAKATTTPVRWTPNDTTAEYTLRISNGTTAAAAWGVAASDILPAPFQLQGTAAAAALSLAAGPAAPAATGPTTVVIGTAGGDLSNSFFIRPGGSITLTFQVSLNGAGGAVYQNPGSVTYADPTRNVAATTISPGGTYAAGGTVPGSNYASGSSTAEDVTVIPVSVVSLATSCPANTTETANLLSNSDFLNTAASLGQANGVALAAADTYPANENVAYQAGYKDYATGGGNATQAPFPGDPARNIPASTNWVLANGNTQAANVGTFWSQQVTGLVPGMTYTFVAYFSSPMRPGVAQADDPQPRFRITQAAATTLTPVNGVAAANLPDETLAVGDRWIIYQATFLASQSTATLAISDANNTTAAEPRGNFALAQPTLRGCPALANLSVTKTNGATSSGAGTTTSYTITVSNAGPGSAAGTTVTDTASAGLNCTTVACASSAANMCPAASFPFANLLSGVQIAPNFAAGQSATLTVTCGVTATGQ